MHIAATVTCLAAFSSFTWAVLRFFTKPSGLTWRAGVVALLGLVFGGWDVVAIWKSTTQTWLVSTGMLAHILSISIFWSAVQACQSRRLTAIFETDEPDHLVQRGPYRYVRHPFYASYTIFWLAGWIASGSVVALVAVMVMLAIYLLGAREEERKFAASQLAGEYADYCRRAGRLLPNLLRTY